MRRLVLFDLDDTLFDHQYSRRAALRVLRDTYPLAASIAFAALEKIQEKHLQSTHALLLEGKLTVPQARRERTRLLFAELGATLDTAELDQADAVFRSAYESARRAVPGAAALLTAVRRQCRTCVVTNGLVRTQMEKIRVCGLEPLLDDIVIAEDVGLKKPGKEIFDLSLQRGGCVPAESAMLGDSWQFDVLGARAAGIVPVWLNRYDEPNPEPGAVAEITSLEPIEQVLPLLLA